MGNRAAFFDLDRTVMSGSSLFPFGREALRRGFYPRKQLAKDAWRQFWFKRRSSSDDQSDSLRDQVLFFVKGKERAAMDEFAPAVVEGCMRQVYPQIAEIIRGHEAEGTATYLVSASPIEIVSLLATELGMTAALATDAAVDDAGRYTGELEGPFCYGEGKALAMHHLAARVGIDLDDSFAYSDSASDLPMLESVGNPVCVNADRRLRDVARERGWETIRVEARHGVRFAVGSGTVGALVAAAAIFFVVRHFVKRR